MNDKESILKQIVDAVVDCCATEIADGVFSLTTEDVLSKNRNKNVVLTRQIIAMQLSHFGYTNTTIAQLFGCSSVNIRS